jgi:hypothetical protein
MMKNANRIVSFLACGFLLCACGYGGQGLDGGTDGQDGSGGDQQQNECAQAVEVQMLGFDQACAGRGTLCCFCKCWNQSRQFYDSELYATNQTCLCEDLQPNPLPCEGSYRDQALACLADQATCRQQAMDMVTNAETGICTLTPL